MPSPRPNPQGRGGQRGPTASVTTRASIQAEASSRVGSIREEPSSDSSDQAGGFGMPASPTSLEARMDRLLSMFEEQRTSFEEQRTSYEEQRSAQAQFQQSLERLERRFEEQKSAQEQAAARLEQRVDAKFAKFDEFLAVHQQWRDSVDDQLASLTRADLAKQEKLDLYSNVQDNHWRLLDDCMNVTGGHVRERGWLEGRDGRTDGGTDGGREGGVSFLYFHCSPPCGPEFLSMRRFFNTPPSYPILHLLSLLLPCRPYIASRQPEQRPKNGIGLMALSLHRPCHLVLLPIHARITTHSHAQPGEGCCEKNVHAQQHKSTERQASTRHCTAG